jgi:POT family proton-dependent oligopeptide transporter
VLIVNAGVKNEAVSAYIAGSGVSLIGFQMFFFAAFALLVAAIFALYALRYKMVDNYRSEGAASLCYPATAKDKS